MPPVFSVPRRSSRVGSHHGTSYDYWPAAHNLFRLAREPGKRTGVQAKVWVDKGVDVGPYGGIGVYNETEKAAMDATKGPSECCRSGAVSIRFTSLEPTPSGPHMINHACANTVDTRFNHE
jgi:hypothetical protein